MASEPSPRAVLCEGVGLSRSGTIHSRNANHRAIRGLTRWREIGAKFNRRMTARRVE